MDHLPAPADPVAPLPEVPYVCKEPYDGGDFLTYPERVGLPLLNLPDGLVRIAAEEFGHALDDSQLEAFLQSWIFFGLLHEVLNKHNLFEATDYVERNQSATKCVHTKNLMRRLRQWTGVVRGWDESQKSAEWTHLSACLKLARNAVPVLEYDNHKNCNRAVVWSLSILLETIANVMDAASYFRSAAPETRSLKLNKAEIGEMIRNGWCIHEILCARKGLPSNAAALYIQRIRRPLLEHDHSECDADNCKRLQIDLAKYQPRHVLKGCECTWAGPDMRDMIRCLDGSTFPVLRINVDALEQLQVEAVPYKDGMQYVAISHVWADGMGNPWANRLPQCQLLRLKELVENIHENSYVRVVDEESIPGQTSDALVAPSNVARETLIWCDTLCCPVQDATNPVSIEELTIVKSKAIGKLHQVYQEAAHVLVLDRGLEQIAWHGIAGLEAATRVFTSRWVRRLWTFQEAALASRLLISFRDTIVDFERIKNDTRLAESEAHELSQRFDLLRLCYQLRCRFGFYSRDEDLDHTQLFKNFYFRRVSLPEDEALCLAAGLGLDVGAVSSKLGGRAARMAEMWQQLAASPNGVPSSIIFSTLSRLSTPGFRWAPSTILQSVVPDATQAYLFARNRNGGRPGILTPLGLRVRLSGWRIRPSQPPGGIPADSIWTGGLQIHHIRSVGGEWYTLHKEEDLQTGRDVRLNELWERRNNRTWHVILDTYMGEPKIYAGRSGLVTSIQGDSCRENTDAFAHQSEMQVWATKLTPSQAFIWEAAYFQMQTVRADWKIEAISSMIAEGHSFKDAWSRVATDLDPDIPYTGSDAPMSKDLYSLCWDLAMQISSVIEDIALNGGTDDASHEMVVDGREILHAASTTFMGNFAHIDEAYDDQTEWVVD